MVKVKLISSNDHTNFEKWLNEFIKDKEVIDIKYSPFTISPEWHNNGTPARIDIIDRAMVIYKED